MIPEFVIPSICPRCLGPATSRVAFCDSADAPRQDVICPSCAMPKPSNDQPRVVMGFDDPDNHTYDEAVSS